VEGINYIHKHMKKSQKNPQGGRIDKEAPLNASKVMLFCGTCQKTTRCRFEFQVTEGKETTEKTQKEKFRCCSRCKGKI
jgi:large subunit ribosomal protein L24